MRVRTGELIGILIVIALLLQAVPVSFASQEDIEAALSRQLPSEVFERPLAPGPPPPLHERLLGQGGLMSGAKAPLGPPGTSNRGPNVYRQRVTGVVLIAAGDVIGTGAVISPSGDIITNAHVVEKAHRAQGEEWLAVWFKPGEGTRPDRDRFLLAKVLYKDVQRDLALVRLVNPLPSTATIIPLATATPEIGQPVFVIGHPKTFLWSFTQGFISQLRPEHRWSYADNIPRVATAIQTQAPVNPGNSGGPLLNDDGLMVGVVIGAPAETEGMFFAVAVQHVRDLLSRRSVK